MITFILAIVALVLGYVIYGAIVDRIFKPSATFKTPAMRKDADGVDYVPMKWGKVMLIQFISIAGTGPIFGAIAGALWGPVAYLWIIFGCIFAGAVHDYFAGMLSVRNNGSSVSEVVGKYLGKTPRNIMRVFSIVLLVLVGTVFTTTPSMIFDNMIAPGPRTHWYFIALAVIIVYYIIATVTPIHKIIGRIYPAFGILLTFTGVAIFVMLFAGGHMTGAPELELRNFHPNQNVSMLAMVFPFLFITIACGAISGFHATQAPLMARCIRNEKEGRKVFYGSMILEGFIAMIWAAAAMNFFDGGILGLQGALPAPNVVTEVSRGLLGPVIGTVVILGVIFFPITSGDTAFRAARLILADSFKFSQQPIKNRFVLALPIFAIGIALCFIDFGIIWRYFAWSNQTLATIVLWTAAAYLAKTGKNYWIALVPATFMTVVVTSYIIIAPEGFRVPNYAIGLTAGLVTAAALFVTFIYFVAIKQRGTLIEEERQLLDEGSRAD